MTKLIGPYHFYRTGSNGMPTNTPTVSNRESTPTQTVPTETGEQNQKSRIAEIRWRSRLLSACITKNRLPENGGSVISARNDSSRLTSLPPEMQMNVLSWLPAEDRRNYRLLSKRAEPVAFLMLQHGHANSPEGLTRLLTIYGAANLKGLTISGDVFTNVDLGVLPATLENLNFSQWQDLDDERLTAALQHFPQLKSLNLSGCQNLTDEGIVEALQHVPQLRRLNLSECEGLTGPAIVTILENTAELRHLNLSGCDGFAGPAVVVGLQNVPQLQHLNLSRCQNITGQAVAAALPHLPELQHLDLSECSNLRGPGLRVISQDYPNLQHLNLSGNSQIIDQDLTRVLEHFPGLRNLNLSRCAGLNSVTLPLPQLEDLDLSNCRYLTLINSENLLSLTRLNLSFCDQIAGSTVNRLLDVCRNLKDINLVSCDSLSTVRVRNMDNLENIQMRGCRQLTALLIQNNPHLRSVNLAGCENLASLNLSDLPVLKELDVSKEVIAFDELDGRVLDVRLQNVSLKLGILNLEGRWFTDSSMPDLRSCTELDTLNISRTNISGSSLVNKIPRALKTLNISNTKITDEHLINSIGVQRCLVHLNIHGSVNITSVGLKPLRRKFPTLESLDVTNCPKVSAHTITKLEELIPRVRWNNPDHGAGPLELT